MSQSTYTTSDGTVFDVSWRKGAKLFSQDALGWAYTESDGRPQRAARTLSAQLVLSPRASRSDANGLMERCALDMDANTPGVWEVNGWKLDCYVLSATALSMHDVDRCYTVELYAPDPIWRREIRLEFMPSSGTLSDIGGIDHEYDFPHDYGSTARGSKLEVASIAPCDFRLTIYGHAAKPSIYIGGNRYGVDVTVPAGGLLIIDSTKKRSMKGDSVVLYDKFGNSQDVFSKRVRGAENSGSYIYQRISHGTHDVTWDQGWGFSLDLIERSVAIPWT